MLDTPALAEALYAAVDARDLPGMVDVDSSLLLFCREIRQEVTVALSGECADELFGGYPWYRDADIRRINGFPLGTEHCLPDTVSPAGNCGGDRCTGICAECLCPHGGCRGKSCRTIPRWNPVCREMMKLNLDWFMQTLLDRKDRMSMYNALEVRVPFCDYRIAEYLYSVPWEYKDLRGAT